MAKRSVRSLRCPTCKKLVLSSEPEYPFCSERCRLIDLGKWASSAYVISSPLRDPEDIERAAAPPKHPDQEKPGDSHSSTKRRP